VLSEAYGKFADFFFSRLYGFEARLFDLYLGTSTAGVQLTSTDFFSSGTDNWSYQGCEWPALRHALKDLRPGNSDVFVDLGSGKGKALLVAGRLPYRRVVGVELDADLAECAKRNIEHARPKLQADLVESEISNVLEWHIPDDASTVFMCNPFFGQTFRDVALRIFDSYDLNPRRLHIVYEHPWEHDWLASTERVVVESVRSSTWPNRRRWRESGDVIVTYHVTGQDDVESSAQCFLRSRSAKVESMAYWKSSNGHPFRVILPRSVAAAAGFQRLEYTKHEVNSPGHGD
jgi:predicted RNA methylase